MLDGVQVTKDDLLEGAAAIAEFLLGDKRHRRKIYYLIESGNLPVIRLGRRKLWARKSRLRAFFDEKERGALRHSDAANDDREAA